jgi:outer membrane protein TolC
MQRHAVIALLGLGLLLFAGCRGVPTPEERAGREQVAAVAARLDVPGANLPALESDAGLSNYLAFALLNAPAVRAAYFDWIAAVERVTVERSRPDPVLTFQADIADVVLAVMPGLMQEFPGPGKLRAAAAVATAESRAKYFAFEAAVLQTAFEVKRAAYQLGFLDEQLRLQRETLALLAELEAAARAQNAAGKVILQDVYRAQIEQDRLTTEIANLEDSRRPLRAQFKAALGLRAGQPDPPVPTRLESTPLALEDDALLEAAFRRNPRLKALEAELQMAEAAIALARKSAVPDFSLGVMADVNASPVMARPLAGMSLPIWRDKIAAQIARATAGREAAVARLSAEQLRLTADFALKSFEYRVLTRTLALLEEKLVPKARRSFEIARAGYLAGQIDFFNLIDAERTLLSFRLQAVEARTRREIALAELSLLIAGFAPLGAPVLGPDTELPEPPAGAPRVATPVASPSSPSRP